MPAFCMCHLGCGLYNTSMYVISVLRGGMGTESLNNVPKVTGSNPSADALNARLLRESFGWSENARAASLTQSLPG